MSTFAVTLEQIETLSPHPNADRLELCKLVGNNYQFIVPKDTYHENQLVVYFPLDSLIPQDILQVIGLEGKLSGKDKNRVKTIKLRGAISQGLVAPVEELFILGKDSNEQIHVGLWGLTAPFVRGSDVTELLGVTKYEIPESVTMSGDHLIALPGFISRFDLENCEKFPNVVDVLMDTPIVVAEKIEGSNFAAGIDEHDQFYVCQRNYAIKTDSDHTWVRTAQKLDLQAILQSWKERFDLDTLVLRGELIGPGVQGNIYNLKEHSILFFDLEMNGVVQDWTMFRDLLWNKLEIVPILFQNVTLRDVLANGSVQDYSNGQSKLADTLREGIVTRPMTEQYHPSIGRLILKQRSPSYLLGSDT